MPDYGHDLRFGVFVTPDARNPHHVVDLAVASESAGLDLITFQDHPYNPALLDAWTLLTWVAARTSRVEVAGNVLNLPLRPPAMLARATAALDALSGGRVALGLGAGAFWDGVAGMGGQRRSPGESVEALGEAIDVIRGLWRGADPSPFRMGGQHYEIPGATRGPTPAHDIPIWVGAYKPRMLRLTGAKANGWLPSLGYVKPADIGPSNTIIDEAAEAAGRDPREVRRLVNVPPVAGGAEQWLDQYLPLILEHGFGTLILTSDDPRTIQIFGQEVAPALRGAVARERASRGTVTGAVRSVAALSRRAPGIDYDALPEPLRGIATEPGDFGYDAVRHSYVHHGSPGLVIGARTTDDVVAALAFARGQDVPISVRSGGHGISGRSTNNGGVVIDLGAMNEITVVDETRGLVRIGPGARWGDVAAALAPHGRAITSGDYGDVGVGGLATAGGLGFLARKHGLTVDHVVGARVVTADGSVQSATAETNPELFWGLRGAGGNLGIVTEFDFIAPEVGDVVFAVLVYDATDAAALLAAWGRLQEAAPRELTGFLTMVPGRRGQPPIGQAMLVYADDDVDAAQRALVPFLGVAPVLNQQAQVGPYAAVVPSQGGIHTGAGMGTMRSAMLEHLDPDVVEAVASMLDVGEAQFVQVRAVGGAVNDVPSDATAFAHRSQNFALSIVAGTGRQDSFDNQWARIAAHADGTYLSFETDPARLPEVFPEPTQNRLRRLKAEYDPDHVFDQNFDIPTIGEVRPTTSTAAG